MDRLLLRPAEAAEALGVSRARVYELIQQGELPSVRIGGSIRVPVDQLRDWIELQLGSANPIVPAPSSEVRTQLSDSGRLSTRTIGKDGESRPATSRRRVAGSSKTAAEGSPSPTT